MTNIIQVYLRQKQYEDALEFADRALHVNLKHVKALSRRAVALKALDKSDYAMRDLKKALALEPNNEDISKQLKDLQQELDDRRAEEEVERLKEKGGKQVSQAFFGPLRQSMMYAVSHSNFAHAHTGRNLEQTGSVSYDIS